MEEEKSAETTIINNQIQNYNEISPEKNQDAYDAKDYETMRRSTSQSEMKLGFSSRTNLQKIPEENQEDNE